MISESFTATVAQKAIVFPLNDNSILHVIKEVPP